MQIRVVSRFFFFTVYSNSCQTFSFHSRFKSVILNEEKLLLKEGFKRNLRLVSVASLVSPECTLNKSSGPKTSYGLQLVLGGKPIRERCVKFNTSEAQIELPPSRSATSLPVVCINVISTPNHKRGIGPTFVADKGLFKLTLILLLSNERLATAEHILV